MSNTKKILLLSRTECTARAAGRGTNANNATYCVSSNAPVQRVYIESKKKWKKKTSPGSLYAINSNKKRKKIHVYMLWRESYIFARTTRPKTENIYKMAFFF